VVRLEFTFKPGKMAKILIVDDNQDLLEAITIIFKIKRHQVETAISEDNLEKKIVSFQPDILFLDVRLGGVDGRKICKEIKLNKDLSFPIILMSASAGLLKNFEECDADAIVEKPIEINTMLKAIHDLLNKYQPELLHLAPYNAATAPSVDVELLKTIAVTIESLVN
jgi:DNA-binding response OmpR family regulator